MQYIGMNTCGAVRRFSREAMKVVMKCGGRKLQEIDDVMCVQETAEESPLGGKFRCPTKNQKKKVFAVERKSIGDSIHSCWEQSKETRLF